MAEIEAEAVAEAVAEAAAEAVAEAVTEAVMEAWQRLKLRRSPVEEIGYGFVSCGEKQLNCGSYVFRTSSSAPRCVASCAASRLS
eukprot:CAMPEP_0183366660 /NCGR_PEP_ID=MMETSP0164_2-20130417/89560_1 /TAXON_ID=221442 /ORGANISM="Coccolithus pelagicus ssp braarudi, Strain PLY182g" /LENGTH=84 /DNA_ID=CAMNT_0025542435 /DNA_START=93 /DNA_END=348 /DNA_ORIENTATION=-